MKCTPVWRLCIQQQGCLSAYKADFARFANDCYSFGRFGGLPFVPLCQSGFGRYGIKFAS
jgi:hypothetical protein